MNGKKYEIANVTKITFDVELISVAHAGHVDAVALDQLHCVLVPKHLIIIMMRMTMMTITMTMVMATIMILLSCSVLVQQNLVG